MSNRGCPFRNYPQANKAYSPKHTKALGRQTIGDYSHKCPNPDPSGTPYVVVGTTLIQTLGVVQFKRRDFGRKIKSGFNWDLNPLSLKLKSNALPLELVSQ